MPINVLMEKRLFSIQGENTQYVISVDSRGLLRHIYWGKTIENLKDFDIYPVPDASSNDSAEDISFEEYSAWGGLRYKEPCIKVRFNDGTRDLVLRYNNFKLNKNQLSIEMKDNFYPLNVTLYYRLYEDLDIIERWVEIKNEGPDDIIIEAANSAEFNFNGDDYSFTNVTGHWAGEQRLYHEKLYSGKKVIESRKGSSAHNSSPYFIIDKNASEDNGDVYFGVLAYSGNFKITVEVTPYNSTRVIAGINDFDFEIRLKSGEIFEVPHVFAGFTSNGLTAVSNKLHNLAVNYLLPQINIDKPLPVLYNSWEASMFNININQQMKLAKKAADIGVELFVVDDGWFGERNNDMAGLGDWNVNKDKFPDGLNPLISYVNSLCMDFGIWIEPEMVNPDSELYRKHPDWVYRFKNRTGTTARNQLVLNLTINDVVEYITGFIDDILSKLNIKYIKWDMNRPLSEPGAENLEIPDMKSIWFLHTKAVYKIVDELRKKHPAVHFEACASGGGRIDFGTIKHFDSFWTSDNTDAYDRLFIQEGFSLVYPQRMMRAWVTDCPNYINRRTIPLKFRFLSAMTGSLGIGGNIENWNETDINTAKNWISIYKKIRHIVQYGKLYRLSSIYKSNLQAVQYSYKNENVVFMLLSSEHFGHELFNIKLKGLNTVKNYIVDIEGQTFEKSGAYLMNAGFSVNMHGDYDSKLIILSEQD